MTLEPAAGSLGVYGIDGDVDHFVEAQGVAPYFEANARYGSLLGTFRERIAATVDFERVEPREFWRRAVREALAESNYDANPIVDAMFDVGEVVGIDEAEIVAAHVELTRRNDSTRVESGTARGGGGDACGESGVLAQRGAVKPRQFETGDAGAAGAGGAASAAPRSFRISIAWVDGSTLG